MSSYSRFVPFFVLAAILVGCGGGGHHSSSGTSSGQVSGASSGSDGTSSGASDGSSTGTDGSSNTGGGSSSGSGTTDGSTGTVRSADLSLSSVLGAVPSTPITSVLPASSSVTTDGTTTKVTLAEPGTNGLLSRVLNLELPNQLLNVGDTIPIVASGTNGATASYSQPAELGLAALGLKASAGGSIQVVARNGNDVTLQIQNLRLNADAASGAVDVNGLTVNGTVQATLP